MPTRFATANSDPNSRGPATPASRGWLGGASPPLVQRCSATIAALEMLQTRRRQDPQRSTPLPQTTTLRRHLPPTHHRPRHDRNGHHHAALLTERSRSVAVLPDKHSTPCRPVQARSKNSPKKRAEIGPNGRRLCWTDVLDHGL